MRRRQWWAVGTRRRQSNKRKTPKALSSDLGVGGYCAHTRLPNTGQAQPHPTLHAHLINLGYNRNGDRGQLQPSPARGDGPQGAIGHDTPEGENGGQIYLVKFFGTWGRFDLF